jgi:hypothetical protein
LGEEEEDESNPKKCNNKSNLEVRKTWNQEDGMNRRHIHKEREG